jgi:hypothetical protein
VRPDDRWVDAAACGPGQGHPSASSRRAVERHQDAKVEARTKAGQQSVTRPDRNKSALVTSTTARDRAYVGFRPVYHRPFLEQCPDQDTTVEMLEIVSDAILDLDTRRFRAVDKAAVLPTFVEPYEAEDGSLVTRTSEDADAALSFLVEQSMVVVDGDMISINPRFAGLFVDPPVSADAHESQIRAS